MGRKKELAETEVMPPEGEGRVILLKKVIIDIKLYLQKIKILLIAKKKFIMLG